MSQRKTELQLLFESVKHTVAIKHQVPPHLTEADLQLILNLLRKPEDRE